MNNSDINMETGRCSVCKKILRKSTARGNTSVKSREQASSYNDKYGRHFQVGDIICVLCFGNLRAKASQGRKALSGGPASKLRPEVIPALAANICNEITINHMQAIVPTPEECERPEGSQHFFSQASGSSQVSANSQQSTSSEETLSKGLSSVSLFAPAEENRTVKSKVRMPIKRTISTHRYCFICYSKTGLHDVPFSARLQVFVKTRIFIPRRNTCCSHHLIGGVFFEEVLTNIRWYSTECSIESDELGRFLDKISDGMNTSLLNRIGKFSISEERARILTGVSWEHLNAIRKLMGNMRASENRTVMEALILFLFKLRSGNSDSLIAATMGLEEHVVNESVNAVHKCFQEQILPTHFGVQSQTREFYISQTSPIAEALFNFGDSLALVCDGTYLRHEKSANNAYQRKSYSGQKKTSLIKPFTICTTNGYVVDIAGPFTANKNDAQILREILERPNGLIKILKPGDTFILDRGFRDVKDFLVGKGFKVLMPALKGKRKQLDTAESNESRFVTKIRWVVESVHGVIGMKFRLLHNQLRNTLLEKATIYCRAAGFLYNLTCERLGSDIENREEIVHRMFSRCHTVNALAQRVEEGHFGRRRVIFTQVSAHELLDFPKLSIEELKILLTGSYQLSQAISYLGEMLNDDNTLTLLYLKEDARVVRFDVSSRHCNSKTYKSFIQYDATLTGLDVLEGYCCSCANGKRTVGCCSHVATVIYYLAHARYQAKIVRPAEILSKLFDLDNICPVIDERDDDWDTDVEGDEDAGALNDDDDDINQADEDSDVDDDYED